MITCSAPWELVQALHPKGFDDISKEVTSESGSSSAVKANFAGDSSGGALFRDPATGFCRCVAVCCSVLQCVAVCCSVLQCVAGVLQSVKCIAVSHVAHTRVSRGALFRDPATGFCRCVAVCCRVLPCAAVCCRAL